MRRNVILVGFMGTGKTTVGLKLAEALGWDFVDSDHKIEELAGMSIREMFETKGEAYFREMETEALRRIFTREKQIVSTGGGAVLKEENRKMMAESGLVAALRADEPTIVARVKGDANRPLLQGNVEERVRALMEARKFAYDFAPLQIDTDRLSVEKVAEQIMAGLENETGSGE